MSASGGYSSRRARKRGVMRKVFVWGAQAAISLGLIGAFVYGFMHWSEQETPYAVSVVRVEGLNRLDETAVLEASGVIVGADLFRMNEAAIAKAVEALPYVRTCSVERIFPETLVLRIREREPVASLMINSHAYEMDAEGVVLREYASTEVPMPPYITNAPNLPVVRPGDRVDNTAVHRALDVWNAFASTNMRSEVQVTELAAFRDDEIVMFAEEIPCEVRWGRGDHLVQAQRLNILWEELGKRLDFREYVDLRFGADIVCR